MADFQIAQRTYLVGSGKGGVGKSTIALNLAVALAQKKLNVGLLDADIYGPSIPTMMGLDKQAPQIDESDTETITVLPFKKFNIEMMSVGCFIEEARSLVWRGPMLHSILAKMLQDVHWGELDVLFIDLPPGAGDVPLSLAQMLQIDGSIIVSTPQKHATLDAIKAINALATLKIPLAGIVENMTTFQEEESITSHLFGKGKGQELAESFHTDFLGKIPIASSIREGGDVGHPNAFKRTGTDPASSAFHLLANTLIYHQKLNALKDHQETT